VGLNLFYFLCSVGQWYDATNGAAAVSEDEVSISSQDEGRGGVYLSSQPEGFLV
jgi:hypothetical protein